MAQTNQKAPDHKAWSKAIAEAWLNDDFRKLLQTNPLAAFLELGIEVDVVFELPPRPAHFSDDIIKPLASGEAYSVPSAMMTCIQGNITAMTCTQEVTSATPPTE